MANWRYTSKIMASRARNKLSVKQVASLTEPNVYSDGGGLYLRIRPSGRSWIFIGTFRRPEEPESEAKKSGKTKEQPKKKPKNPHRLELGLGNALDVSLAKARERAAEIRGMLVDGIDPRAERAKAKKKVAVKEKSAETFGTFAMGLVDDIEDGFKCPSSEHLAQLAG